MLQEPDAPHAAGGDGAARGQGIQAAGSFGNEHVLDGRPGQDGADFEPGIEQGGDVLEAMDGGMDAAGAESGFEFLGEDAFVDHRAVAFGEVRQAQVGPEIAGGFDDFAVDGKFRPGGLQGGGGEHGLGEREFAAAGS